jgi:hypothetical protein
VHSRSFVDERNHVTCTIQSSAIARKAHHHTSLRWHFLAMRKNDVTHLLASLIGLDEVLFVEWSHATSLAFLAFAIRFARFLSALGDRSFFGCIGSMIALCGFP